MPGERITQSEIRYLQKQSSLGGALFGIREGNVLVVKER
jgi:arginine/lysine/ornithine decarboxylase